MMKSKFQISHETETLIFGEHQATMYVWRAPDGERIGTHLILACPSCKFPLSLAVSEFNFETNTLHHQIRCPARWRKGEQVLIDGESRFMAELNPKGKPTILRCNWSGHIIEGQVHGSLDTSKPLRETRSREE